MKIVAKRGNRNLGSSSSWKKWIGLGLIGLSGIWFAFIFIVQFLGFSLAIRAYLVDGILLPNGGNVLCWLVPSRKTSYCQGIGDRYD